MTEKQFMLVKSYDTKYDDLDKARAALASHNLRDELQVVAITEVPELTKEEKRKLCRGCYNDYYNGQGAKECWSLESAKFTMKKFVHKNHVPPWNHEAEKTLTCHIKQDFVTARPDQTC
jgi:hypothetical protein